MGVLQERRFRRLRGDRYRSSGLGIRFLVARRLGRLCFANTLPTISNTRIEHGMAGVARTGSSSAHLIGRIVLCHFGAKLMWMNVPKLSSGVRDALSSSNQLIQGRLVQPRVVGICIQKIRG